MHELNYSEMEILFLLFTNQNIIINRQRNCDQDAREDLAREKASANELSAKLYTTEKDLSFKIKVGTYFQQKPRH